MNKSQLARHRQRQLLQQHGHKSWDAADLRVLITGDKREGSIGEAIVQLLRSERGAYVESLDLDLTKNLLGTGRNFVFNTLIMCHGKTSLDWFEDADMKDVKEVMDVNLYGTYNTAAWFVRNTIDTIDRKRIIIVGSMAYRNVLNGSAMYCASKAGVAMLSRCMAWELTPKGYDVFCIHPSNVDDTPMSRDTIEGIMVYQDITRAEAEDYWSNEYLRGHSLSKHDIATLVSRLLMGDGSEWMSGANIELGGGQR